MKWFVIIYYRWLIIGGQIISDKIDKWYEVPVVYSI